MTNWIDEALLDFQIYKLRRVGRKHMTQYELWRGWINE
jgi:hypothetical protein